MLTSWTRCRLLPIQALSSTIRGFSTTASSKSSSSKNELKNYQQKNSAGFKENHKYVRSRYRFTVDENGYVEVFTDGACISNGGENPKAGIGVWFGDEHPLNISQRLMGRATCNVAEIKAVTAAAQQARKAGVKKLKINTDSQFLIHCATIWMKKWKMCGWMNSSRKPVINKDELVEMEGALTSIKVMWKHVPSHTGIYGNEKAHILAKTATTFINVDVSNNIVEESFPGDVYSSPDEDQAEANFFKQHTLYK